MANQTIRELQTCLPWTIRYSRDFRSNSQAHKDFAHALTHVGKASGKLCGLVDDMDHDREIADQLDKEQWGKYVADLVVCALRMANTFPGGVLDLQTEVQKRIENKNGPLLEDFPEERDSPEKNLIDVFYRTLSKWKEKMEVPENAYVRNGKWVRDIDFYVVQIRDCTSNEIDQWRRFESAKNILSYL